MSAQLSEPFRAACKGPTLVCSTRRLAKLRRVQMARSKDEQEPPVSAQGSSGDRSSQGPALQRTLAALVTEEASGHSVL